MLTRAEARTVSENLNVKKELLCQPPCWLSGLWWPDRHLSPETGASSREKQLAPDERTAPTDAAWPLQHNGQVPATAPKWSPAAQPASAGTEASAFVLPHSP